MPESSFHFKQFSIHQEQSAMKVGTDAVLLGSWTRVGEAFSILDIGTGTGIIAIMLAQRSSAHIDAIEIDESSYQQAVDNALASPWNDRIRVINDSFQHYASEVTNQYDLLVSNPPFFTEASKPSEKARNTARHTDESLTFDELIDGSLKLMAAQARLSIILPIPESKIFTAKAIESGLHVSRSVKVVTRDGKPGKRQLLEFANYPTSCTEEELFLQHKDSSYTKQYLELTSDYYLGLRKYRNNN